MTPTPNPTPEELLQQQQLEQAQHDEAARRTAAGNNGQAAATVSIAQFNDLNEKLAKLQDRYMDLASSRLAESGRQSQQSNITVKTMVNVPALADKMTFADYKFEVTNWCHYAGAHMKKEDLAWVLLNQLPPTDPKMVKRTVIERLGMEKLRGENGVTLMLEEMRSILECEPFTRLVEWLQAWESLAQGNKSYEQYTTLLRKLSKQAADDFKVNIPQPMQVAKLLLGCQAVKGTNIAVLTNGIDLNGLGDTLYSTVEAKVKTFIGTTDAFTSIKSGSTHNHSVFIAKDWKGNPIVSPEKVEVPSLTSGDLEGDEEFKEAYLAYKQNKSRGGAHSRLGPVDSSGGKPETKDERRERLKREGKCFEHGCLDPLNHLFENCPTRKVRIAKRKAEVLAKGGVWYDDPNEAKRMRNLKKGGRPENQPATAGSSSSAVKRSFLQTVQSVPRASFSQPPDDEDMIMDVLDDDLILDANDEETYNRLFTTKRILMATTYDVPETVHHVNFSGTESTLDEALVDSGCQKSCCGLVAYNGYLTTLSEKDKLEVREHVGTARFKFGGAGVYTSLKEVLIPLYIAGMKMRLRMDIVDTDIPLLLGLPVLKQLNLTVEYSKKGDDFGFFHAAKFRIYNKSGHQYIRISKQGSIDAIVPQEDTNSQLRVFISKVNVFDQPKLKSQLKMLHTNYAHMSKDKIIEVIKGCGQWQPEMDKVLDDIYASCPVRRCRERVNTQLCNKAAFRKATRLGDMVTTDLKIRPGKGPIMYLIDYATSFAVGAIIDSKASEDTAKMVVTKWYGAGLPRIRQLTSDNGKEFCGPEFRAVMEKFSTARKFTVPFHPEMNGACERIHSIIDLNMAKLQEEDSSIDDHSALTWALLAYNATPTFTGYAPAQLVYGSHNVLTPSQDLSPVECQDPDTNSSILKDLLAREKAIENHSIIRNSKKLREVVLGRSRPTPEVKRLGSYVWFKRHGSWMGPAQVGMSLAGECSVKNGNVWYNAKHCELLPLTDAELEAHNLTPIAEEQDQSDTSSDISSRGSSADTSCPPSDDEQGIIEVDFTLDNLLDKSRPTPQSDLISDGERSGGATRNGGTNVTSPEEGPEPSQVSGPQLGRSATTNSVPFGQEGVPLSGSLEVEETHSDIAAKSQVSSTGGKDSALAPSGFKRRGMKRSAQAAATNPPTSSSGVPNTSGDKSASNIESGQGVPSITEPGQGVTSSNEPSAEEVSTNESGPRDTSSPSVVAADNRASGQGGLSFDPNLVNRPAIDVAVHRFRAKQQVRICNPDTNEIEDVTICNGFKRANERSWYRFVDSKGSKRVLDFNEIVWDFQYSETLLARRSRIEPNKTYRVHHTIIHPSQHHRPDVIEAKTKEIDNHSKFGTFDMVRESSLNEQQKSKIIPSTWAVVYKGTPGAGKVKARLCARGDREPNVESIRTDAPTASKDSIRILLSVAASTAWKLHSLDFQAAFIQGKDIDRELFMRPPPDVRQANPGMLFRLIKRIYGLRDASRGWILEVREFLLSLGMEQSAMDRALFFIKDKAGKLIGLIVTHIDDFLFIGNETFHREIIHKVLRRYVVGTLEDTSLTFTGWELAQSSEGITLTQQSYHEQINLEQFSHMRLFTAKDSELLGESDQHNYRKLVGILNWLVTSSKPALAHLSNHASLKLGKASKADAKALYRALEKAKGEPEVIKFSNLGKPSEWHLEIFADAALGKNFDPNTYTGDIAFIKGRNNVHNVINWSATKLDIPTSSILNGEAEAVTNAHGKLKYLRFIFNELFGFQLPASINTDSRSLHATVTSDNSIRNRRISAAVATIRSVKTKEGIILKWVKGLDNLADPLTKQNANSAGLRHILSTGQLLKMV